MLVAAGCSTADSSTSPSSANASATASPSGSTACATDDLLAPPGTSTQTINVGGEPRTYMLHVPPSYQVGTPTPLVMAFHGMGSNANQQLLLTGMTTTSDTHGFILVAPEARSGQWQLPTGAETAADTAANADFAYLTAMATDLNDMVCIDRTRQYASGMSLGSALTLVLACAPNRTFAAFGGVGAAFYSPACDNAPPAPLIYFHGTADAVVPIAGGLAPLGQTVAAIPDSMSAWAAHNDCTAVTQSSIGTDVTLTAWTACANDADVDFYAVTGGGHTWPGSDPGVAAYVADRLGYTTQSVDASELMWEFFSRYQLPAAVSAT